MSVSENLPKVRVLSPDYSLSGRFRVQMVWDCKNQHLTGNIGDCNSITRRPFNPTQAIANDSMKLTLYLARSVHWAC